MVFLYTYFYLISSKILKNLHLFMMEATTRLLQRRKLFIERSQRTRVISSWNAPVCEQKPAAMLVVVAPYNINESIW